MHDDRPDAPRPDAPHPNQPRSPVPSSSGSPGPSSPRDDYQEQLRSLRLREEALRLREEERRQAVARRDSVLQRVARGIYYLVGALEILLGLRFVLRLFGANPENPFARAIATLSGPYVVPFENLFGVPAFGGGGQVLDVNVLVAMAIYALLGLLAVRLLRVVMD